MSCEDCATGYTRSTEGLYLGLCQPCQCFGHASICHTETGVCIVSIFQWVCNNSKKMLLQYILSAMNFFNMHCQRWFCHKWFTANFTILIL